MKKGKVRGFGVAGLLACAVLAATAAPAGAVQGAITVLPSPTYTVGVPASTRIVVQETDAGVGDATDVSGIELYAGCTSFGQDCDGLTDLDPGFGFGPVGVGDGEGTITPGEACTGTWTISQNFTPGTFLLMGPNAVVGLGSGASCSITFAGTALRLPAVDAHLPTPGLQTVFHAQAFFSGGVDTRRDFSQTTVNPAPLVPAAATIPTTAAAGPTGQRNTALAACKKKRSKKKRKKCRKAALALPA